MGEKTTGEIVQKFNYEETHIEWIIPCIFSVIKDDKFSHKSTIFSVGKLNFILKLCTHTLKDLGFVYFTPKRVSGETRLTKLEQYSFGLKTFNGTVQPLERPNVETLPPLYYSDGRVCITLSKLLEMKSKLAPCDVITVICTLKYKWTDYYKSVLPDDETTLKLISLERLSENFKNIFGDKESCDITLKVKRKVYKAHRVVLIARSTVFAAMFKSDTSYRQTGVITIPDCDPTSFKEFLEFLYCGKLEGITVQTALDLYETSHKYDVQELKEFCVKCLLSHCTTDFVCSIFVLANKYNESKLISVAQEFFNKNVNRILATYEWKYFMKKNFPLANKLLIAMPKAGVFSDGVKKRKVY